jgi:superfamily II RNA helicase
MKKIIYENSKIPEEVIERYVVISEQKKTAINKKRKELEREYQSIKEEWFSIEQEKDKYLSYKEKKLELEKMEKEYDDTLYYLKRNINNILNFLEEELFVVKVDTNKEEYKLTTLGFISSQIKEVHNLVFALLIHNEKFNQLTPKQIVKILSCFTSVTVGDDFKSITLQTNDESIKEIIDEVNSCYDKYQDFETNNQIETGLEYNIQYDLLEYIEQWYDASNAEECKYILQNIEKEKEIFVGEFIKAILKINTISSEMEKIAESIVNIELLHKLKEIPKNTLKFVATNQSLYL